MRRRRGKGLLNTAINRLPFEVHIPGYRFCGPGTRLAERLARGDVARNRLDEACKRHDIAYERFADIENRHKADQILQKEAWERVKSSDASLGEKLAALGVGAAMKTKIKLGMGAKVRCGAGVVRRRRTTRKRAKRGGAIPFRKLVRAGWDALKTVKPIEVGRAAQVALDRIRQLGKKVTRPRIIPIPKTGGFLPLIPLFAGLSALGALSGGAAGIAKAVTDAKAAQSQLKEAERHNQTMEAIAMGKGLYLKPYRKGLGLFLGKKKTSANVTQPTLDRCRSS